jgi:hypothetical protein
MGLTIIESNQSGSTSIIFIFSKFEKINSLVEQAILVQPSKSLQQTPIDAPQCPVYATGASRLDFPLFNLIINEQIDPMTYILFQDGNQFF